MFDLEKAVADWRRQMMEGGIKNPSILNELEAHLRDYAEEKMQTGMTPEAAFETARSEMGHVPQLRTEFHKLGGFQAVQETIKQLVYTLAGIPGELANNTMTTTYPNIEPRWATYLKTLAFLAPALCIWTLSVVFVFPKIQWIWSQGGDGTPLPSMLRTMMYLTNHGTFLWGGLVAALVLLEWRWTAWPRFRRGTLGVGTFVINGAVLIAVFLMVIAAVLAAPGLANR